MRSVQLKTRRVFDTPVAMVIGAMVVTLGLLFASTHADSLFLVSGQKTGLYIITMVMVGMTAYISHVWLWGRNETYT